jgi:hypothetical protein
VQNEENGRGVWRRVGGDGLAGRFWGDSEAVSVRRREFYVSRLAFTFQGAQRLVTVLR